MLLNFSDRMGTGVSNMVNPLTKQVIYIFTQIGSFETWLVAVNFRLRKLLNEYDNQVNCFMKLTPEAVFLVVCDPFMNEL